MRKQWLAAALMVAMGAGSAWAYREGDSQLWLAAGADTPAGRSGVIGFEAGARWGDSMSDHFYSNFEPYVIWKARPWLDVALSDEFSSSKKGGEWLDEQTPKLSVTLRGDAGPLVLSNRSRMEYRLREEASDEWRYRDRLRLQLARGWTAVKCRPYLEDELYFSVDEQLFNENRASAGLSLEPRPWLKADVYYLVRSTLKDEVWTDSNVIGAKFGFVF